MGSQIQAVKKKAAKKKPAAGGDIPSETKPPASDETKGETTKKKKAVKKKPASDKATGKLTPQQIRDLPIVNEEVTAQNLQPNCQCILTPGCEGRIVVYSTHKRTEKDKSTGQPLRTVRSQYLKCTRCARTPVNPRRVVQNHVDAKSFDRRRVEAD